MSDRFLLFFNNIYTLFRIYLFQLLTFTAFRFAFVIRLQETSDFFNLPSDLARAFLRGFQFDTMIISYSLILPLLIYLAQLIIAAKRYKKVIDLSVCWFCGIALAIFILILFIDQYYYSYFQSHINVLIFGLIDDDTQAVMSSVWYDYPVIRIFSIWAIILFGYILYIGKFNQRKPFTLKLPNWMNALICVAILLVFIAGIRQSLGTFPLQIHDAAVSENKSVNFLTINGVYALKNAFSDRKNTENLPQAALNRLKDLGYKSPLKAAADYFLEDQQNVFSSDTSAYDRLFQYTPKKTFLEQNKPNVVFIFMESMSNYNMNYDSEQADLLGTLRKHFKSDILFRNFVSSENATIQSLEYLLINSPLSVSKSKYRFLSYPSSVANPFVKAGFETSFITGGEIFWRNLHEFVPHQGFQSIAGKQDILNTIKNSKSNHWGVYDEHLFEFTLKKLARNSGKPKFMFIQTTTNHTPFELPDSYRPGKISLSKMVKNKLLISEDLALKNLRAFQYANSCLGNFLDKLKKSGLAENTIVVMTGDHNNLMLFDFNESQQLQQRGVPLYMYIPKQYRPDHRIDTSRFGSHKDIFPTIYHLSLSAGRYYSIGNNLLEEPGYDKDKYFGINTASSTAFSTHAGVQYSSEPVFYKMTAKKQLERHQEDAAAKRLLRQARGNYALSLFYILKIIKEGDFDHKANGGQADLLSLKN